MLFLLINLQLHNINMDSSRENIKLHYQLYSAVYLMNKNMTFHLLRTFCKTGLQLQWVI